MEGHRLKRQIALDSNVLFDLAEGVNATTEFREILQDRGYTLRVPPTVIQELHFLSSISDARTATATMALRSMLEWDIHPFDLVSVGHAITEQFAQSLIHSGLLPPGEFNDGLILAETSLAEIPVLITLDGHLLGIDPAALALALQERDLSPVHPLHPRDMLRVLG